MLKEKHKYDRLELWWLLVWPTSAEQRALDWESEDLSPSVLHYT